MEERDPEGSIFEITDFTNATPWESFIADLEGLFRQWELAKPDHVHEPPSSQPQHRKTERISYSGRDFVVSLEVDGRGRDGSHRNDGELDWPPALHEMMESYKDFPPKAHHLARWYGLSQLVVISPAEGVESLHSQAQANLMLSSISVAISNTGCTTPVFVQLHQPWRQVYVGVCEDRKVRVDFNITHLRHTPPLFSHLSGLLDIFKSKLQCPLPKMDPVKIAIRFLYVLKHWSLDDWPVEPLGDVDKSYDSDYLRTLRVGAFTDPVKELHLSTIWPKLTEELVTDTGNFSDLNPNHAAVWTVGLHLTEKASCILAENLMNFFQLCYRSGSMAELLGKTSLWDDDITGTSSDSYSKPLDRLTSPGSTLASPLFHSVVYTATQRLESGRKAEENITESDLETIMKFLFPDAYQSDYTSDTTAKGDGPLVYKLKSAPEDSMTSHLAKVLSIVNTECGVKAMCKVWHEVTLELRWRWENGVLLPNIPEGSPDMKCCLLHQKLQMLNCCIRHKISHQRKSKHKPNIHDHTPTHSTMDGPVPNPSGSSSNLPNMSRPQMKHSANTNTNSKPTSDPSTSAVAKDVESATTERRPEKSVSASESSEDEFFEALESQDEDEDTPERGPPRNPSSSAPEEREGEAGEGERRSPEHHSEIKGPEASRTEGTGEGGGRDEGDSVGGGDEVVRDGSEEVAGGGEEMRGAGERVRGGEDADMGRLKRCGDLVLVATGEPMYIPITQDHAPLTEDHVWEQQSVMAKLGTSEEAARVRAKMQSSSVMSDMQAFKAANPGCLLEDFVRWYSPRDWLEGDSEEGGTEGTTEGVGSSSGGTGGPNSKGTAEKKPKFDVEEGKEEEEREEEREGGGEGGGWAEEEWGGEWDVIGEEGEMEQGEAGEGEKEREGEKEEEEEEEVKQMEEGDMQQEVAGEAKEEVAGSTEPAQPSEKWVVTGRLSLRMQNPHNIWREAWSIAEPLPSHKQKKLFDDTREAEKVLHYLAGLKTAELALLVLPVLMHCAIQALQDKHATQPLSAVESHLQDALSLLATIPHPSLDSLPKYREVISLLSQIEHLQAAAFSLRLKLAQGLEMRAHEVEERTRELELGASVEVLLQEPELVLQDPTSSLTGLALQGLLTAQVATRDLEEQESIRKKIKVSTDTFPPPSGREFILRSILPRPSPHSLPTPQRMYCVLTPQEFRLAGAFSMDTQIT